MSIRWDTIQVGGKPMRVYVATPERAEPRPGIVVAQHAGGVDEFIQDVVHRLHREGYVVAAPELFHRQPTAGVEASARTGLLRDDEIIADMNATIAHLQAMPTTVVPIGVLGFCMGGRVSYLMAGAGNQAIKAAVVFYGGNTMKALGDGPSPFERSANINCPMLGLFGADDANPSAADVQKLDAELTRLNKWHEFHSYRDTGHGFSNFINPERYGERAARAAWTEMLAFFTEKLKRAA